MGSYHLVVPPTIRTPANQQSADGVGVSTPCGAVSCQGIAAFVPVVDV